MNNASLSTYFFFHCPCLYNDNYIGSSRTRPRILNSIVPVPAQDLEFLYINHIIKEILLLERHRTSFKLQADSATNFPMSLATVPQMLETTIII